MKSKFYLERMGISYSVRLKEGVNMIGRTSTSEVMISGSYGSRLHCKISVHGENVKLIDFSLNGTFINETEYKGTTVNLLENDKIGIGVSGVDNDLHKDCYHVFKLRKIRLENNTVSNNITENSDLVIDSGAQNTKLDDLVKVKIENFSEGESCSTNKLAVIPVTNIKVENCETIFVEKCNSIDDSEKGNVKCEIDNILENNSNPEGERELLESQSCKLLQITNETMDIENERQNNYFITEISEDKSNVNGQNAQAHSHKISSKLDRNSTNVNLNKVKCEMNENLENNLNSEEENHFLDFQSDELSQALCNEIKEEIAELDLNEFKIRNEDEYINIQDNLTNFVDICDLTLDNDDLSSDEDEDFDPVTRQWYMKLSQNFEESFEKNLNESTNINLKLTELNKDYSPTVNLEENLLKITEGPTENYQGKDLSKIDNYSIGQKKFNESTNINSVGIDVKRDVPALFSEKNSLKNNEEQRENNKNKGVNKIDNFSIGPNKRKSSVLLIDAPSFPPKRNKEACTRPVLIPQPKLKKIHPIKIINPSPKKNLREHYSKQDKQTLKLQKKWLESPNTLKAKTKTEKIKAQRKEKLKELAQKNCSNKKINDQEKNGTLNQKLSVDNLDNDEKNKLIKKSRVKLTDKNRGAFLVELPSGSSNNTMKRRKTIDVSTELKDNTTSSLTDNLKNQHGEKNGKTQTSVSFDDMNVEKKKLLTKSKIKSSDKNLGGVMTKSPSGSSHKILKRRQTIQTSTEISNKTKTSSSINAIKKPIIKQRKEKESLKSCLKSINNLIGTKTNKKNVTFNPDCTIHTYEIDVEIKENEEQTPVKQINKKNVMQPDLSYYEGRKRIWNLKFSAKTDNQLDDILTEVLSWKTEWLDDEKLNKIESKVQCPMIHSFKNFDEYKGIVFPLMKLELWGRINKDKEKFLNNVIEVNLNDVETNEINKRVVLFCYYESSCPINRPLFGNSELVLIKILDSKVMFGYVKANRCTNPFSTNDSKSYIIELESYSYSNIMEDLKKVGFLYIQKLSAISTELGAFNAVNNLIYSPLLNKILNPTLLTENNEIIMDLELKKCKYNGYDKLNNIQTNILMQTYLKTINPAKDNIIFIEGPPGTGKSILITNLVLQILYGHQWRSLDKKILICAQSNTAVDVITQKLIRIRQKMEHNKFRLVRYGVLDKMHPEVRPYSLIELTKLQKSATNSKNSLLGEKKLLEEKMKRLKTCGSSTNSTYFQYEKTKEDLNKINMLLNENLNEIDRNLEYKFLSHANIVCTTLSSCVRLLKRCNYFDICIIDEATQCTEPWTLVPLQFGINSLILFGDTQQLPATTLSNLSKSYNFGKSYFTRAKEVMEITDQSTIMKLNIQYRMHPEISKWPNSYFYDSCLSNGNIIPKNSSVRPYTIIELNFNQNKIQENGKIENCSEAVFVIKLVKALVNVMATNKFSYGIITPYSQHCQNLREKLKKEKLEIEVGTIDSYQGKEKDVIIISNARTRGIGFLNEICRLNVALTRARECLILCGNFKHLTNLKVWESLLFDAKKRNTYIEPTESDLENFGTKILDYLKP